MTKTQSHTSVTASTRLIKMIFRGLYYFSVAYDKGKAEDPVKYFAAKKNQDLGVVKALRKPVSKLDLSPFPAPS